MNRLNWGDLTPEKFLNEYWQKKPLLIKNAFRDFTDPITPDELAGLAMEEGLESRIISHKNKSNWQVQHGPFESFDQFGEQNWTLLMQAVNNFSKETHALLSHFNFVPSWRIDDVMVSYSTPNGGVGAHLDQYDVFIIQGAGKRRWQVGLPDPTLTELIPHQDLKQISPFEPYIDEITEAGDLLYIPPNHPHNGISIENSMNFSIGFQAPNSQELWSTFTDKLIDQNRGEQRFNDKDRKLAADPALLSQEDIGSLKNFMLSQLEDENFFSEFIGNYLTQCHHPLEILVPVTPFTTDDIKQLIDEGDVVFYKVSGIKSLFVNQPNNALHFNGESFDLDTDTDSETVASLLANEQCLTVKEFKSFSVCLKKLTLLTNLLNKGYWYIE